MRERYCCVIVESRNTQISGMLNTVSVYKIGMRGKETSPCYGFLLPGHWPRELSVTHPRTHKKNTNASKRVYAPHQPPWRICRQTVVLTLFKVFWISTAQFMLWPRKTLGSSGYSLPDSSSISFQTVSMLVSTIFLLCQSQVFHQSGCVTTRLLFHVFICPPSIAEFPAFKMSLCADGHPQRLASRHLCFFCL